MALSADLETRIVEFQHAVGVPAYNPVIDRLLRKVADLRIQLNWWTGSESSKQQILYGFGWIDIKTVVPSGNYKELVFDLLHELGHYLDKEKLTDPNDDALVQAREIRAWRLADEEFSRHPELTGDRANYEAYKRKLLGTYGVTLPDSSV
jgi:hypothetical protein